MLLSLTLNIGSEEKLVGHDELSFGSIVQWVAVHCMKMRELYDED